jgi:serine/threonine protein kinase
MESSVLNDPRLSKGIFIPHSLFSQVQNFLEHMIAVDVECRYTANLALQHPWITRQDKVIAPLNNLEILKCFNTVNKIMKVINAVKFCIRYDLIIPPKTQEIPKNEPDDDNDEFLTNQQKFDMLFQK